MVMDALRRAAVNCPARNTVYQQSKVRCFKGQPAPALGAKRPAEPQTATPEGDAYIVPSSPPYRAPGIPPVKVRRPPLAIQKGGIPRDSPRARGTGLPAVLCPNCQD